MQGPPTGRHQDLHSTLSQGPLQYLGQIFIYDAPWNPCKSVKEGHCLELIRSLCQDPTESAKISTVTVPQWERSDTLKVPRRLRQPCQHSHRAITRVIRHAQSAEKVARAMSKFAPRHNESRFTGTKCWEGCASHIKIPTTPQGERADTHKVTRGLQERHQYSHCATRASQHAQSDKSCVQSRATQYCACHDEKWAQGQLSRTLCASLPA